MKWAPVPGFDRYEVSEDGRIRSRDMVVGAKGGATQTRRGRELKTVLKQNGYLQVTLCREDGKRVSALVHRIVLSAFNGESELQTRHLDGTRTVNRLENLKWGTAADNAADRARHGTFVSNLPNVINY